MTRMREAMLIILTVPIFDLDGWTCVCRFVTLNILYIFMRQHMSMYAIRQLNSKDFFQ